VFVQITILSTRPTSRPGLDDPTLLSLSLHAWEGLKRAEREREREREKENHQHTHAAPTGFPGPEIMSNWFILAAMMD
jgi:hypothetical protein